MIKNSVNPDEYTLEQLKETPIKHLPIEAKIVVAHKLADQAHITAYRIAQLLGLGKSSVYRYLEETEIPKTKLWDDLGNSVLKLFKHKTDEIRAQLLSHIEGKIPEASLDESTKLLKVIIEVQREEKRVNIKSDNTVVFQVVKSDK